MNEQERRHEEILTFGAITDEADRLQRTAATNAGVASDLLKMWRAAPHAAALELAKLIVEFEEYLPPSRREQLVSVGAVLTITGRKLDSLFEGVADV